MATKLSGNYVKVGVGTSDPTADSGGLFFNTADQALKLKTSGGWTVVKGLRDGLSSASAVYSGQDLVNNNPSANSGTYYVNPLGTNSVIQMYIDTSADGGGYDFYNCSGCTATTLVTQSNGCPAGTSWVFGRTRNHWSVMITQFGTNSSPNAGAVYKPASGGNYTSQIMRNPSHHASGASDWRVPDGGKWWLRDTTHNEPNGDYTGNGWLQTYPSQTAGNDIGFNDGGAYSTGTTYLCSTNVKTGL